MRKTISETPLRSKSDLSSPQCEKNVSSKGKKTRTYAFLGFPSFDLPETELVPSKPRVQWLESLRKDGYAGLLLLKMRSLNRVEGFNLSWWVENRRYADKDIIPVPFGGNDPAAILTVEKGFTVNSVLSSIACTICELIGSDKDEQYCVSAPQLILPSEKGFCKEFRWDFNSDIAFYRCFWFLGTHIEEEGEDERFEIESARSQEVFIASAGDCIKTFGDEVALTLEAYFGEAERKFALYSGDILVMRSKYPFAVDPAIGENGLGSRIVSWQVLPKKDIKALPALMPKLAVLKNIEDVAARNEEAMIHYKKEVESLITNSRSTESPEGRTEILRVTPGRFKEAIIYDHAKCNSSIIPLDGKLFS